LAALGDLTFVACGSDVVSYKRAKEVSRFTCGEDDRLSIASLEIFGQHIISICSDNSVKLNDHTTGGKEPTFRSVVESNRTSGR
jgi:U3 small nucleolar RNA-associated protein 21